MQMSASINAEGNTGGNSGNFLQMIQAMTAGQTGASGTAFTDIAGGSTDGNPFSQILLQQIVMLLQAGGVQLPDATASKEELLSAFKKLLDGDQTQADGALSELAMLAMAGQQLLERNGSSFISAGAETSDTTELINQTGFGGTKDFLPAGQLTALIVQAIRESLKDASSSGKDQTEINSEMSQGAVATLNNASKEAKQKDPAGAEKFAVAVSEEIKSILKNENGEIGHGKISGLNGVAPAKTDTIVSGIDQEVALSSETAGTAATDAINGKQKVIAAEMMASKPAAENTSVESELGKAGVNVKVMMPQQEAKTAGDSSVKGQDDHSDLLKVGDPDGRNAKKSAPVEADVLNNDRKTDSAANETKNNVSGKDMRQSASLTADSQGVADKFKTELKSKTGNTERTSENANPNAVAVPAGVQAKEGAGDTSSTSIINRVAAEFRENMMSEGGRVKITLTPPSLGSLEMDVSVVNSKVKVMLIAENKDVQKMLSGNIETLKTTLQTQGLTIERCDVMMQDSRDEYPQGFSGQQAFGQEQTSGERKSGRETSDAKSLEHPAGGMVQRAVGRPQYSGAESISLFA